MNPKCSKGTGYEGISEQSEVAQSHGVQITQHVGARPQRRIVPAQGRPVRHNRQISSNTEHKQKAQRRWQRDVAVSRISNYPKMTMLAALDARQLDPFNVYPQSKLPQYLQALIDHTLIHIVNPWLASDRRQEAEHARAELISQCVAEPLVWYPIMMAGITHYSYVHQQALPHRSPTENHAGKIHRMLRLSYKTKAIAQICAALQRDNGVPSDAALLAMSLLMAHGSSQNDDLAFAKLDDPIQMRKAFGTATNMQYYSSILFEAQHWQSVVRFINNVRGGICGIHWPLMQQSLQLIDTAIAWRNLQQPLLGLSVPTSRIMATASHQPDKIADAQMRKLLSGLPLTWRTSPEQPHANLYLCLQHIRALVVRYDQYQRHQTSTQADLRPDLRLIIYTRSMVLHDLLELPIITTNGGGADGIYELIRHSALVFMQLVLFPIASSNQLARKILEEMHPLLALCWKVQANQSASKPSLNHYIDTMAATNRLEPDRAELSKSLLLWAWILAGMLAFEHLQAQQDSAWVDVLAPMVDNFAIRPEKASWSEVKSVMETFLWMQSECDGPGQRWWNYACLWLDAKKRETAQKMVEEDKRM